MSKNRKDKRSAVDGEFSVISEAKEQINKNEFGDELNDNWVGEGDRQRAAAVAKAMAGNSGEPVPPRRKGKYSVMLIHWNGRFGNRMHQYAYGATYAKENDMDFYLPSEWEGTHLFKNQKHQVVEDDELRLWLNQTSKEMDTLNSRMEAIKRYTERSGEKFNYVNVDKPDQNYRLQGNVCFDSVCAYHTSIFEKMSKDFLLNDVFEFSDHVKNTDLFKRMEDRQGTYDIAHLRRDDISNVNYKQNGGYSVVSKESYEKAFEKFGYDKSKVEWTSDDWTGKWNVGKPEKNFGWHYPEGAVYHSAEIFDWFEDFLRLYFARTIFRANSSFSWWASFLSQQREEPAKIFAPRLDKKILYASKETYKQEADFEFEEGNHPHWLCTTKENRCNDIFIN
tara:strand:+ start:1709 stop:2887 length:1179 start_codon:yes stop_codon:yes gene_type:complete